MGRKIENPPPKPEWYDGGWACEVPLGGELAKSLGVRCLIDLEDADRVFAYNWFANRQGGRGFYARTNTRNPDGTRGSMLMHRFILGAKPGEFIDHLSGLTFDNRKKNLRFATSAENCQNTRSCKGSVSVYKGVSRTANRRSWLANVQHEKAQKGLGVYATEVEAALAYDEAVRELFGEFGRYNFPMPGERSAVRDRKGVPGYMDVCHIVPKKLQKRYNQLTDQDRAWILLSYRPGRKKGEVGTARIARKFGVTLVMAHQWAKALRNRYLALGNPGNHVGLLTEAAA